MCVFTISLTLSPGKRYSPIKRERDMQMRTAFHEHSLILNEHYIAREGDVCSGCNEQIFSCKSFVYSCSRSSTGSTSSANTGGVDKRCFDFLMHKTCAELPSSIKNPTHQKELLFLRFEPIQSFSSALLYGRRPNCYVCGIQWRGFSYCHSFTQFYVCIKCVIFQIHSLEDRSLDHPSHPQHTLALVQRPSSFKCDACKVDDNSRDLSYICTKCPFWMHKSCAHAPTSFQFQFHDKHPLVLSYSLPKFYHKYHQYCRLCNGTVGPLNWLYYCPKCRFFAHFQCARSSPMSSSDENEKCDYDMVHLPAPDESSVNLLLEQLIKDRGNNNDYSNGNFSTTNGIKHWIHGEHHLQLITIDEFNDQKGDDDDEMLLVCESCVKPIRTDGDLFFACVSCKSYLHKVCVEFPKEIEHHLLPHKTLLATKLSAPYNCFYCDGCHVTCNGIFFSRFGDSAPFGNLFDPIVRDFRLHIGCAALPKMLKHEAHSHKLNQVYSGVYGRNCKACGLRIDEFKHGCKECDYYVCHGCIMKPRRVKHPWDPHPLNLIYEPGLAMDHEHDFNCEFCSEDIDANLWFYHCSVCDLSFHLDKCFERSCYREYSNVKFGASNIIIDKIHDHGLTFVLSKKVRSCKICNEKQLGKPVLECAAPCKAIFCIRCCSP